MTELEWLRDSDPKPMLAWLRKKASVRKLYLVAIACGREGRRDTLDDVNAYDAFEAAADFHEPRLAMLKAVERFPGYYGFEGPPWPLAEAAIRPRQYSLWPKRVMLLREMFGNPFHPILADPAWLTSDVLALARGIYEERAFDRMPILADALQDAGCDNTDVLNHCRDTSLVHVRGCWVVDLLLAKT